MPQQSQQDRNKYLPPGIRFLWGSFKFDGIVEGLEESLEFFSPEGRPLRASVTLNMSQQKIEVLRNRGAASGAPGAQDGEAPGTRPLAQAPAGATVQGMAALQGQGENWQEIAAANKIENPRLLRPGQLLDMNVSAGPRR
jgi:nucleoid-associated protein YgaU